MKFGKRAGVSVVLDENRQIRKLVSQSLFQPDAAPAGQMRRIDQDAFGDLQRPAYRNADRERLPARSPRGFNRLLYQTGDSRKGLVERARGFGSDLLALQNLGLRGAFDDRSFRSPDVQTDDRPIRKIHFGSLLLRRALFGKKQNRNGYSSFSETLSYVFQSLENSIAVFTSQCIEQLP